MHEIHYTIKLRIQSCYTEYTPGLYETKYRKRLIRDYSLFSATILTKRSNQNCQYLLNKDHSVLAKVNVDMHN